MQDASGADALGALAAIVGAENVVTDPAERDYVSQDYFRAAAAAVAAVVRPGSTAELSRVVATATRAGYAVYPRGAGYSYTDAYLPTRHPAITIDMGRMTRIVAINATDMYATVEAGCSWAALDGALEPLGLRVPMWGPLSGRTATVGGGVSQGCVSLGSSKYGTSADSVLGLEVVAADGTVVRTGTSAQGKHAPFFRPYGPDVTGLFCADAGALGVKATVTLRLMARPRYIAGASFAFDDFDRTAQAMAAVARLGVASESLGMSIAALRAAATSAGLVQDLKTLLAIVRSAANPVLGLMQGARVVLAGRRFLNRPAEHAAHFVVEGHGLREISGQLAAVRAAARRFGSEMPNTAPMAMRAAPFNTYDMLNIDGRRQLPFHGILPWSQAAPFNRAYRAVLDAEAARLARMEMSVISVYSGISTNGLLFEPVILWPDVAEAFHRRHSSAAALARIKATAPNLEARAYAADLRERIVALMFDHGAVHLQIGKTYPYLRERSPAQAALLRGVKQMMDPNGLINPGALGLG